MTECPKCETHEVDGRRCAVCGVQMCEACWEWVCGSPTCSVVTCEDCVPCPTLIMTADGIRPLNEYTFADMAAGALDPQVAAPIYNAVAEPPCPGCGWIEAQVQDAP